MAIAPTAVQPVPEEDPAAQVVQARQDVLPVVVWYVPRAQLVQDAVLAAALNVPAAQIVHTRLAVAPAAAQPVPEENPAAQVAHARQALAPVALT